MLKLPSIARFLGCAGWFVWAALLAACGGGGEDHSSQPAAYFMDGVEYGFDYALDAQGRIDSYRVFRRPGLAYDDSTGANETLWECKGSLRATFECVRGSGFYNLIRGELGRITQARCQGQDWCSGGTGSVDFSYGPFGLSRIVSSYSRPPHGRSYAETTITYDSAGRLSAVAVAGTGGYCYIVCPSVLATSQITLDSLGRLLHADTTVTVRLSNETRESQFATDWRYDAAGLMKEAVSTSPTGALVSATRFVADANGWLATRVVQSPTQGDLADAYAIASDATGIVEERFTQAEPRLFYYWRLAQRVRYEEGRRPVEPFFVPRALGGRSAEDFIATVPLQFLQD